MATCSYPPIKYVIRNACEHLIFNASIVKQNQTYSYQMGVSLNGGTPQTPRKPMVVGETHHFRKPPNGDKRPRVERVSRLTSAATPRKQ